MTDKIYLNPEKFENKNAEFFSYISYKSARNKLSTWLSLCNNVSSTEFNNYVNSHWEEGIEEAKKSFKKLTKSNKSNVMLLALCKIFTREDCPYDLTGVYKEYQADQAKYWDEHPIEIHRVECRTFNPLTGEW